MSGSGDSKKTASTDIVFIIAPAVVGTVALIAVVIAIVFIRRKGELQDILERERERLFCTSIFSSNFYIRICFVFLLNSNELCYLKIN